jgi:L-arabinose isomerase
MTIKFPSSELSSVKVGLFGIGLNTYWDQFDGLLERLKKYQKRVEKKLLSFGSDVFDAGMVDTVKKANETANSFRKENVDLIFLYISTYALSETVLPIAQKNEVPIIILNLQPDSSIDYKAFNSIEDNVEKTGEWLANCQACAVPEIASVFNRSGIEFFQVTGTLEDDDTWEEIKEWIEACKVANTMQKNRVGLLGHYYSGMLDIYSDPTQLAAYFGSHVEHLEIDDLLTVHGSISQKDIKEKVEQMNIVFNVIDECPDEEMERAAKTSCALDKLVNKNNLDSLVYYYEGAEQSKIEDIIGSMIVGNSLLTAHNIPVAGEYDIKNVHAMKILDSFEVGGSFTEFYAMDYDKNIILMGHDGPAHIDISQDQPKVKPLSLYHGKQSHGLSIEMQVKKGPVTVLAVTQNAKGELRLLVAEGESIPGPILEIGNTNSRYKFPISIKEYIEKWSREGPAHHCAVGIGHIGPKIHKLGSLMEMEVVQIC